MYCANSIFMLIFLSRNYDHFQSGGTSKHKDILNSNADCKNRNSGGLFDHPTNQSYKINMEGENAG